MIEAFQNYCASRGRRSAVLGILMYNNTYTAVPALRRSPSAARSLRFEKASPNLLNLHAFAVDAFAE